MRFNTILQMAVVLVGGPVLDVSAADLPVPGIGGEFPVPGKSVLPMPLEKREIRWIKSSGLSGYQEGEAAIALPDGFDPQRAYPVLVTCVTGDPYLSNILEMDKYWPQSAKKGWVTVTGWADPHPKRDTTLYRRAVSVAAIRVLREQFPQSGDWPVAVAGFSGGSKNAAMIAAYLQGEGYRIIGVFMGGCNQDLATYSLRKLTPDRKAYLEIPFFLSTGKTDRVSTVEDSQDVAKSMRKSGFRHVRLETHEGAHFLNREHVSVALDWFRSLNGSAEGEQADEGGE